MQNLQCLLCLVFDAFTFRIIIYRCLKHYIRFSRILHGLTSAKLPWCAKLGGRWELFIPFVFVQRHRLAQLLSWSRVFPLLYFFLFRQQKIPLYGRTFPSWRGWPWPTSLVSSGQAGQSYGYSHVFFSLLPLISISKFYSPVHTSGVLWLRDSRSTCRAATSQTVSSTLATLGLFCKRS